MPQSAEERSLRTTLTYDGHASGLLGGIEKAMADGVAIGPEWLMRTNQPERLTHVFDPITEVCAKCYMTRAQWEDNRKPRCGGGTQQGLVRLFIDPEDEPDSRDD
jgi:hypothetical protein